MRFRLMGHATPEGPAVDGADAAARAILTAAADMGHPDDRLSVEPDRAPNARPRLDLDVRAIDTDWGYDHARTLHIEPVPGGPLTDVDWRAWWPRSDGPPGMSPTVGDWEDLRAWLATGLQAYEAACRTIMDIETNEGNRT